MYGKYGEGVIGDKGSRRKKGSREGEGLTDLMNFQEAQSF